MTPSSSSWSRRECRRRRGLRGTSFAEESDFVDIRGGHHRGDGAIGHGHQAIFDSIYSGSTRELPCWTLPARSRPGPIVAVATSTLDAPHGPLQGVHNSRMTLVVAEQDDDWRVVAFHNTLVVEAG